MILTGTHKTKCVICGSKDNIVMRYNGKSMADLCYSCVISGVNVANRNTMMFIIRYSEDCQRICPGCHYGSEFSNDCIDKFEEIVWMGFLGNWIKNNRRVF